MKITDFLNDTYSDSALYINYRSTPSYIDGFKNSGRKCLYTIKKRGPKAEIKVSNFAGAITEESNYLHGPTSMEGTIVTLSQSYCGANNVPILEGVGAFGTRFCNEAAATRYIFVKSTSYLDLLFKKEDDPNLLSQEFEGDEIEPVFYVPTLPMLLVNGSSGIGVGFSSKVFSRSTANMIKAIRTKISGKKLSKDLFVPSWKGFKGEVKNIEGVKWEIRGVADIDGKKVMITEVPITWDLSDYTQNLKDLKDMPKECKNPKKWVKRIEKFVDYSEDDNFKFEVRLTDEEAAKSKDEIMKDLGLIVTDTENLTCIDENNAIREYDSITAIFNDYYAIKIKYLEKRLKSEIKRLSEEEQALKETYKFIKEVIKGTVNLKLKKAEVEKVLKEKGYTIIDKLLSMPLYSISADKAAEIEKKWKDKQAEIEKMKAETATSIWLKDLDALEDTLKKEKLI